MTDTPLDLDAIEARTNAATDGPWSWEVSDDRRWVDVTAPDYERVIATTHDDDLADFIAHARTDVPALVAALRDAQATIHRMDAATLGALDRALGRKSDLGSVGGIEALAAERDLAQAEVERLGAWVEQSESLDEMQRLVEKANAATARAEKAEAQVAAVLAECRKVATVSGNASGYPYVLVNTIVGAIERAS